jgi:hypothetical protein
MIAWTVRACCRDGDYMRTVELDDCGIFPWHTRALISARVCGDWQAIPDPDGHRHLRAGDQGG